MGGPRTTGHTLEAQPVLTRRSLSHIQEFWSGIGGVVVLEVVLGCQSSKGLIPVLVGSVRLRRGYGRAVEAVGGAVHLRREKLPAWEGRQKSGPRPKAQDHPRAATLQTGPLPTALPHLLAKVLLCRVVQWESPGPWGG
jgi:hypothetical protein